MVTLGLELEEIMERNTFPSSLDSVLSVIATNTSFYNMNQQQNQNQTVRGQLQNTVVQSSPLETFTVDEQYKNLTNGTYPFAKEQIIRNQEEPSFSTIILSGFPFN
ncbi:22588_t:CDS:2 [Gigaspora rosea]|nr:22588_t:CDS:2 [Gigaspora rosea]